MVSGELLDAIKRDFGSVDAFRNMMTAKTVAVQGSGWGWLVSDLGEFNSPPQEQLCTCTTPIYELLIITV